MAKRTKLALAGAPLTGESKNTNVISFGPKHKPSPRPLPASDETRQRIVLNLPLLRSAILCLQESETSLSNQLQNSHALDPVCLAELPEHFSIAAKELELIARILRSSSDRLRRLAENEPKEGWDAHVQTFI